MGNFSRDTFDRLKHYVGVRLQQGVPIVDADWNELEDIKKYELQAFLKWFVGNGVPEGNDGFRILAVADTNDFAIQGGDGTAEGAGHCLIEGWDVINESDLRYSNQALFDANLAANWGVDALASLTTPASDRDRTDTVYLDVWEREVDSTEDYDHLVNPAIGIETAVRLKREWVVRVAENATEPPPPPADHVYYSLAHLNRVRGEAIVTTDQIEDLRLTGLTIVSYRDVEQIVTDAYGPTYMLDHDGQPNLKVSLRDAINAMLGGGLPSTPEEAITPVASADVGLSTVVDSSGDIWVFWFSDRSGNGDIWYDRYDSASSIWQGNTQLTTDPGFDYVPFAVMGNNGDIWAFWRSDRSGSNAVWYDRYDWATGSWQGNTQLTEDTGDDEDPIAVMDDSGDVWVFWQSDRSGKIEIWYDRYDSVTGWLGNTQLATDVEGYPRTAVVVDRNGDIWVFWGSEQSGNGDIWYDRYNSVADWQGNTPLTTDLGYDYDPYAVVDSGGDIWVFWVSDRSGNDDIWYRYYSQATSSWGGDIQLTTDADADYLPYVLGDSRGDIWVFWTSRNSVENKYDVKYKRFTGDGEWGNTISLTTTTGIDLGPFAVEDTEGDLWVFWNRNTTPYDFHILNRKLFPTI